MLKTGYLLNIDEIWCRLRIKVAGDSTKLDNYFKKYIGVLINKVKRIVYFFYDNNGNDIRVFRPIENFLGD